MVNKVEGHGVILTVWVYKLSWFGCAVMTFMATTVAELTLRRGLVKSSTNCESSLATRRNYVTPAYCSIKKWDGICQCPFSGGTLHWNGPF